MDIAYVESSTVDAWSRDHRDREISAAKDIARRHQLILWFGVLLGDAATAHARGHLSEGHAIAGALDAVVPYVELEPIVVAGRLIMILTADETITVNVNSD